MKTELRELVSAAAQKGADYADIYIQTGAGHSIHYEDGRTEEITSSNTDGCGARVIADGKTFYSHAPGCSASHAAKAFSAVMDSSGLGGLNRASFPDGRLIDAEYSANPLDAEIFQKLDKEVRASSRDIRQVAFRYSVSQRNILIIRGDGTFVEDQRDYCSFAAQVIAERNGELQTGAERRSMALRKDDFWTGSTPEEVARAALDRALLMLDAKPCPAGKMNILLAGEAGGTIVHEACGHGLEADIVEKDFSVYRNKLGERVAGEMITMVDDPTIPCLYGSYKYDDEGTPGQKNVLIENGVLKKYLTDILCAKSYGMPKTGNGRRQSYRSIPVPRMSNTYLMPGESEFGEMLEKMGSGLLVKKMGGGEVDPTSGDFVFYVSEAWLVANGRVSYPVRGATLIGNGPETLTNIVSLGKSLVMDPGVCGKSGQGVPVTDGQPSMIIRGMTVGGSEETRG